MYVAEVSKLQVNPCILTDIRPVTQKGQVFAPYSIVKNWLAFTTSGDESPEQLFFIHQISPKFIVLRVENVTARAMEAAVAYSTDTPAALLQVDAAAQSPVALSPAARPSRGSGAPTLVQQGTTTMYLSPEQLAYQSTAESATKVTRVVRGADKKDDSMTTVTSIHGNVNPVFVSAADSSRFSGYFLSIFHTVSDDSAQNYMHYAFAFCRAPPFDIFALSPPLPLSTAPTSRTNGTCGSAPFAFASGLALTTCTSGDAGGAVDESVVKCLLFSYGVCDAESRVSEVRLHEFEETFTVFHTCDDDQG
jgi:hypothetical protein